jgi:hypothetical protein
MTEATEQSMNSFTAMFPDWDAASVHDGLHCEFNPAEKQFVQGSAIDNLLRRTLTKWRQSICMEIIMTFYNQPDETYI